MSQRRAQQGVTLIELVVTITVISIAAVALMSAVAANTVKSADAMARQQAIAVAQSYLEEIVLRPFHDPDTTATEAARADYDDIDDYNGLADTGVHDQLGRAVTGLGAYNVQVAVAASGALGSLSSTLVKRIDVTVTAPTGYVIKLSAYRADY
jgi:MSHA pilin protein MshD